jgi:hypothetical protein
VALTIISMVLGVLWYMAHLDARLSAVETAKKVDSVSANVTCADMATKVADAYRAGDAKNVAEPLERLMDRMGCGAPSARPQAEG